MTVYECMVNMGGYEMDFDGRNYLEEHVFQKQLSETAVYGLRAFHIVRITSCGMRVDMGAGICYHPYCGKQRARWKGGA